MELGLIGLGRMAPIWQSGYYEPVIPASVMPVMQAL